MLGTYFWKKNELFLVPRQVVWKFTCGAIGSVLFRREAMYLGLKKLLVYVANKHKELRASFVFSNLPHEFISLYPIHALKFMKVFFFLHNVSSLCSSLINYLFYCCCNIYSQNIFRPLHQQSTYQYLYWIWPIGWKHSVELYYLSKKYNNNKKS